MTCLQHLNHEELIHVIKRLSYADVAALKIACPSLLHTIAAAQASWFLQSLQTATLVTIIRARHINRVIVSVPTKDGYMVDGTHVSRRMYVHEFPRMCMQHTVGMGQWHAESHLCFDRGAVPAAFRSFRWADVSTMHAEAQWFGVFQRHARFYVGWRVGPPRRHRGRRAQRWSKVPATGHL